MGPAGEETEGGDSDQSPRPAPKAEYRPIPKAECLPVFDVSLKLGESDSDQGGGRGLSHGGRASTGGHMCYKTQTHLKVTYISKDLFAGGGDCAKG